MERFVIEGKTPLSGKIRIQGAKNAALPILAGSLLAEGIYEIVDVPHLLDINVMLEILYSLGAKVGFNNNIVTLDTNGVSSTEIQPKLMSLMRSSIFLMGPLLARFNEVTVSRPGGCAIGERKIDLHLKGLKALGAVIEEKEDFITCRAKKLIGTEIFLDYPSVGATENIMMAATRAIGETKIINAAKEPEIVDLQNFLIKMGAKISGAGTNVIIIKGVNNLHPVSYQIIPDRIVAGTYMVAVGLAGGNLQISNVIPEHIAIVLEYLRAIGIEIDIDNDIINVESNGKVMRSIDKITTAPYPGFPTDMQAQFMSLLTITNGVSIIEEKVFDSRYKHINDLKLMGADIKIWNNAAYINGVDTLKGCQVEATDLRAGAALILAGLAAEGKTIISKIHHIDRGYERIEDTLRAVGAKIIREMG